MKKVTVNLPIDIYLIEQGEYIVAYSPLTYVSSYGMTEEQAVESYKEVHEIRLEHQSTHQEAWLKELKLEEE